MQFPEGLEDSPFKKNNKKFVKKICGFVDSEFVKTCHEHVIQHSTHNKKVTGLFVERYKAETIYFNPAFWRTVIKSTQYKKLAPNALWFTT